MNRTLRIAVSCVLLGVARASAQEAERTTLDKVFSAAQTERGRSVYSRVCSECHTRSQFSRADGFQKNWQGRTFFDVFEQLRSTMPQDNPGGIPRRDYVDVLAYLLNEFGYPSGETDLPATEPGMKSIRIVAPEDSGNHRPVLPSGARRQR
jgi:mono/diheme cytochrome c family protein